ncbi:MAG TPA: hypothetical protein VEN81_01800 [Planctomycetota bacterium]|nr:hypothetical protein [Planctomycetota bacterium]
MNRLHLAHAVLLAASFAARGARADVGDPQVKTDHPWYPGELACSNFDRLFATEAALYKRVVGAEPKSDEEKALAAWLWRNTHYWHGTEGAEDLWGKGWNQGGDTRTRDFWKGLFADGYGLCGTTHSQWTAEMEALFGHNRGRTLGVNGHNSFEVFLTGGPYGSGKWVLLDHDISTVVFSEDGSHLLSMPEVKANLEKLCDPAYHPEKQHGWIVSGLHPRDAAGVYTQYSCAEYLAGYAGMPPLVHLRRGETLRRILLPGLEDGKTFVYWGQNLNSGGIPGPSRPQTWVNQPDRMYRAKEATPYKEGQARFANAVYTYTPNFANGDYKEGVVDEGADHVTFEFYTPFIIGCTPPNSKEWGIYDAGGRNGLVLRGRTPCPVSISVDQGRTWREAGTLGESLDLTDHAKGYRQYLLRLGSDPKALARAGLTIRTVCQMSSSMLPRLKDGGTEVSFESSGRGVISAGPTLPQAQAHVVEGGFGTRAVTLELSTPRKEPIASIVAVAQVASSCPPSPDIKYQIDLSLDGGRSWKPFVKDWTIPRRGDEPPDFWSMSLCYGSLDLSEGQATSARIRLHNDGGKNYLRAELHLVYRESVQDPTQVTFAWKDDAGDHRESHVFAPGKPAPWPLRTGKGVVTQWVEFESQRGN